MSDDRGVRVPSLKDVQMRVHRAAWRFGLDVMPVGAESRGVADFASEDVVRLQAVIQRVLGYGRDQVDQPTPEWTGLVADAFRLAAEGSVPHAQLLQDVWVLRKTGFRHGGFFIEVGAGDGSYLSNTWLLEHCFDWSGLLCEPNPVLAEATRRRGRPRAVVDDRAVWSRSGEAVDFVLADEHSAISSVEGDVHSAARRRATRATAPVRVQTVSPVDLLADHAVPTEIDFLSVDTEGSEPDILRSFPWSHYTVGLITVEHNHRPGRLAELDRIVLPHGYRRVLPEWSSYDAWYERVPNPASGP